MFRRLGQQTAAPLQQIGSWRTDRQVHHVRVVNIEHGIGVEQVAVVRVLHLRRHLVVAVAAVASARNAVERKNQREDV